MITSFCLLKVNLSFGESQILCIRDIKVAVITLGFFFVFLWGFFCFVLFWFCLLVLRGGLSEKQDLTFRETNILFTL